MKQRNACIYIKRAHETNITTNISVAFEMEKETFLCRVKREQLLVSSRRDNSIRVNALENNAVWWISKISFPLFLHLHNEERRRSSKMIFKIKYLLRQRRKKNFFIVVVFGSYIFPTRNDNNRKVLHEIFQLKSLNPFLIKPRRDGTEIFVPERRTIKFFSFFLSRVACEQREVFPFLLCFRNEEGEELKTRERA